MCNDCRRIEKFYNQVKVTKEEQEQEDIRLRWQKQKFMNPTCPSVRLVSGEVKP
jgi:hypothetical protein